MVYPTTFQMSRPIRYSRLLALTSMACLVGCNSGRRFDEDLFFSVFYSRPSQPVALIRVFSTAELGFLSEKSLLEQPLQRWELKGQDQRDFVNAFHSDRSRKDVDGTKLSGSMLQVIIYPPKGDPSTFRMIDGAAGQTSVTALGGSVYVVEASITDFLNSRFPK